MRSASEKKAKRIPTHCWFEELFGISESSYEKVAAQLEICGGGMKIRSRANKKSYTIGEFSTPTLEELRREAEKCHRAGRIRVHHITTGDVLNMHSKPECSGGMFQVASQFNCLEFVSPENIPEDGVSCYAWDMTQGPACAIAAGPATAFRNYCVEHDKKRGQRATHQINNLSTLERFLDNDKHRFWQMVNGYVNSGKDALTRLNESFAKHKKDTLRSKLRIGVQYGVEVTFGQRSGDSMHVLNSNKPIIVSQVFCSALSISYTSVPAKYWKKFACIVLDATYEATLLAAVINAAKHNGSNKVYLTFVGDGAFGNRKVWIANAIERALQICRGYDLDIYIVHFRSIDPCYQGLGGVSDDSSSESECKQDLEASDRALDQDQGCTNRDIGIQQSRIRESEHKETVLGGSDTIEANDNTNSKSEKHTIGKRKAEVISTAETKAVTTQIKRSPDEKNATSITTKSEGVKRQATLLTYFKRRS